MPHEPPARAEAEHRSRLGVMVVIRVLLFFLVAAVTLLASLRVAADPTGLREVAWAIDWWFPILASVGLTMAIIAIDLLTPRKKLSTISGVFLGLLGGLVAAIAVSFLVDLVVETYRVEGLRAQQVVSAVKILFGIAACYLGVSIVLQTQDDFRLVIPYVEFAKQIRGAKPLVQDSSALIDGRILDLAETGFIQSPIIIPRFIVSELQALADSSDKLKRARGKRGLEIVTRLQRSPTLDVTIDETPIPGKSVDQMLVDLARRMPAVIVTNDAALLRVASIHGVGVINMNEVANSLKRSAVAGEPLRVRIVKRGEQAGQGVGYLEDGTMVVADDGAARIGEEVTLTVTSSLQTSAGRLIFGRVESEDEAPVPHDPRESAPRLRPSAESPAAGPPDDRSDGHSAPAPAASDSSSPPSGPAPPAPARPDRKRATVRNPRRN